MEKLSKNKNLNNALGYLRSNGYIFDSKSILLGQERKRHTFSVQKKDKNYWVCVVQTENKTYLEKFLREIAVIDGLKNSYFKYTPEIIKYSKDYYWSLRLSIEGMIAGNVYDFFRNFLNSNQSISNLIDVLEGLATLKINLTERLLASFLVDNALIAQSKSKSHKRLIDRFIRILNNKGNLINDQSCFTFLHGDLQPTNIVLEYQSGRPFLIDFESCKIGNPLFDFASLYHRAEFVHLWQFDFKRQYIESMLKIKLKFNEELFNLFLGYFFVLDLSSLETIYYLGIDKPLHNTEISSFQAKRKIEQYSYELKRLLIPFTPT